MPSVSKKQHKLMAAVANNPKFAKKVGIPQSVGEDFMEADKGKKFRMGGPTRAGINKPKTHHGKDQLPNYSLLKYAGKKEGGILKGNEMKESKTMMKKEISFMKKKGAPKSMIKHEMAEAKGMQKVKKMGTGGLPVGSPEKGGGVKQPPRSGIPVKPRAVQQPVRPAPKPGRPAVQQPVRPGATKPKANEPLVPVRGGGMYPASMAATMKKGGYAAGGRMTAKGEHAVQKQSKRGAQMVKMAHGGLAAGHKQADGIAKKGKTKATQIKMRKGGYC